MKVLARTVFAIGGRIVRKGDELEVDDDATTRRLLADGKVEIVEIAPLPPPEPPPGPPVLVTAKVPIVHAGRLRPAGSQVVIGEHDARHQIAAGTVEAVGELPPPSGDPDPMVKIHVTTAHWLGGQQGVWCEVGSVHEVHRVTAAASVASGAARILEDLANGQS